MELLILSPVDLAQIKKLEESLSQVPDLRLVLVSGSVDEGMRIAVSAGKPMSLVDILRKMPLVAQADKKDKEIQLSLKAE
ncbi:MAG: hypothetical protein E3J67_00270 [Dehalococcoidia bacterium]|nr:MAG: hypothetical protein E3J67_00270 [Dehalococcoidia bacterium]